MASRRYPDKIPLITQNWYGGFSSDTNIGPPHSFAYGRSIDFRKSPSQFTILPATRKDSGSVVTDLVTDMVQVADGTRYAIGDAGNFYKRTTGGTWSLIGTLASSAYGLVYRQDMDAIYIPTLTDVARYSPISNNPTLQAAKYAQSLDGTAVTGGAQTYTITHPGGGGLSEAAADQFLYVPTIEPAYSVKLKVVAKGTGDWTVFMHDDANNQIATSTVTNANLTNGALNEFVFTTPGRMLVKPNARTYHIHATSTVADGTVQTAVASNFSNPDREIRGARLISPNNGMHPIGIFQQYVGICNERYLSVWEPLSEAPLNTEWLRHRLTFPTGYEACGLAQTAQFWAIACEKRSSTATAGFQSGKIFLWDGVAQTYNDFIDVPEGSPGSLFSHKNALYYFAAGAWWIWTGGQPVKLRQMPNTDTEYAAAGQYTISNPNMMAVRNSILLGGFPSFTSSTTVEHGVYSYGNRDKDYPSSFGFSYPISTGTLTNGALKLGMIKSFADSLFISWKDGSNYGVDIVDPTSNPYTTASEQSLIFDRGRIDKLKFAVLLRYDFLALPAGASVTIKYKIDNAVGWTSTTTSTVGATSLLLNINKEFHQIQFACDLTATTLTPTIQQRVFTYDSEWRQVD